jgi:hypothetical protein
MFSLKTMKRYSIEKMCSITVGQELLSMEKPISDRKQRVVLVKENNFHLF